MATVREVGPRASGSTHYIVCEVQGRQCLVPQSHPNNLNLTFFVTLDPQSGRQLYVNVATNAKSWVLPDIEAEAAVDPSPKDSDATPSPPATVTTSGTSYELTPCDDGERYVPQRLPFEPLPMHCWRPVWEASDGHFVYENCETAERATKLPPLEHYCDAVRQLYGFYKIEGSYIDAIRQHFGSERRLAESLSIQYGPMPLRSEEAMEVAECYFHRYDKSMLAGTDNLLEKWRGNEIAFLDALCKKYGKRPRTTRERVRAIYAQRDPAKMLYCDEQVDQYKKREEELLEVLECQFGPELIKETEPMEVITQRVRCQLLKYDPARAAEAEKLLMKHMGAEVQLLELLVCHYGPEVGPAEREHLLKSLAQTMWGDADDACGENQEVTDKEPLVKEATAAAKESAALTTEMNAGNCTSDNMPYESRIENALKGPVSRMRLFAEELAPALVPRVAMPSNGVTLEVKTSAETNTPKAPSHTAAVEAAFTALPEPDDTVWRPRRTPSAAQDGASFPPDASLHVGRVWRRHAEILEVERRLRDREFQKQQKCMQLEEERLAREFEAHQRLVAFESERRWKKEATKMMEFAESAAVHTVQELTRLQPRQDDASGSEERAEDVARQKKYCQAVEALNSANGALVGQFAQMKVQLGEALASVKSYAEQNERLRAENVQMANRFVDVQRQYELELQGMRMHLDDTRVRATTRISEQEVKLLHLKKQEEERVANVLRELERERDNTAAAKEAWERGKAEAQANIASLRQELATTAEERECLKATLGSREVALRARTKELEELYDAMGRQRAARSEVESQTEALDFGVVPAEVHASADSFSACLSTQLTHSVSIPPEVKNLQKALSESQRTVLELLAEGNKKAAECEQAHAVIGMLRQQVRSLESTVEKLELRYLAVPDIPECATPQDVAVANLKDDLLKVGNQLLKTDAESTQLKREIRGLRSLLSLYMSNAKK
ncbi:hypothetical protein TraAM80_07404 [Trypanosoma rangeli]|uniref:Uncharacterized protein n=1 Tax=Trypanosoma rangeli TaxID=5698 RepID=A0A422N5P7_TRYRA|nr:uncharacterized protein TraAM80_07404 [Trypanosoma rangeli]RNF00780.1 hypothetical protein TraAM80_07404 [Trypanosoma rangeli]|eukprot:RNF00780.1 hypothetical protein TraAM80_07404 [Trypanosoma rangeli]